MEAAFHLSYFWIHHIQKKHTTRYSSVWGVFKFLFIISFIVMSLVKQMSQQLTMTKCFLHDSESQYKILIKILGSFSMNRAFS